MAKKTTKKVSRKTVTKAKKSARAAAPVKKRRYEGASRSKRMSGWKTTSSDANAAMVTSLSELRNRSRDLRRNNPYAAKAVQVIGANVVNTGIVTQFREGDYLGAELHWADWAETTAIDFEGRQNIYAMQGMVMEAVVESGEVLMRRRINVARRYPIQYQILEPDFLDSTKTTSEVEGGGFILQGIEFSAQGERKAYWLYESHPGGVDANQIRSSNQSHRVPVEELRHIFRADRPGQARGVPWCSPVMVRLKDFDDMEDAQLMRQKIAACFTAFVQDISHEFYPVNEDDDLYGAEHGEDDGVAYGERLVPGIIEELPRGKTVKFAEPPSVDNYHEYSSTVLHAIAAGYGITYEALTGDYSELNFSSGRMGFLEFQRNIKIWQERIIIAQMLDPIIEDFKMMLEIQGENVVGLKHVHVAPPREMIDPTKEVPMQIEEMRSGLDSISDKLLARGKDPRKHLKQMAEDMALLDELGLKLTSDPRVELSNKGKNKVTGEIGDENENENETPARSTPRGLRADKLRRQEKHNGRRLEHRRAS